MSHKYDLARPEFSHHVILSPKKKNTRSVVHVETELMLKKGIGWARNCSLILFDNNYGLNLKPAN